MPLKLSIISPSYNQAEFIKRTLDSVASQNYRLIEHIIQDAGSASDCRAIIDDYVARNPFAKVFYEADEGQQDAILRGFRKATGDIFAWLNTDDYYVDPDVIAEIMRVFEDEPETDIVYGRGRFVDTSGVPIRETFVHRDSKNLPDHFVHSVGILQPSLFFRRRMVEADRPIDQSMTCAFDYELWMRMLKDGGRFKFVDRLVSDATFHPGAKTSALRARQLLESALAVRKHYGFASVEWLQRVAECELHGINGIVDAPGRTRSDQVSKALTLLLFFRFNANNRALLSLLSAPATKGYTKTLEKARDTGLVDFDKIIVTTFDDHYLDQGLSMIRTARQHHGGSIPIFVYSLNLSAPVVRQIEAMHNVHVVEYPAHAVSSYEDFLSPKNYGYKCAAIDDSQKFVKAGGSVLWIDAGVAVINPLDYIFGLIEKDHVFFVDHDDKPTWPFYNGTFCHPVACELMGASIAELFGEHLCSCLIGYKKGGSFARLFKEAHEFSLDRRIVVWDKFPTAAGSPAEPRGARRAPKRSLARRIATTPDLMSAMDRPGAEEALGYLGHRQDQSIFSILAARYGAPLSSATTYCRSDDASSSASRRNWLSGSVSSDLAVTSVVPSCIASAVTYHHRGTFLSNGIPQRRLASSETLVLIGNGPSLKGFDLKRFDVFDTMGMNAAYRYWNQIGWYPSYYICLDKVVGLSHKDEISRLIAERTRNGIRAFFLRANLIKELPAEIAAVDCVFDFDHIRVNAPLFSAMPITTGSHAALVGALLGYERLILAGIDCNYVERVGGSEERGGTILEITGRTQNNPNYFFDNYQIVGDKYNIPNSSPGLHLDSWRAVAPVLAARGLTVWNMSMTSQLDNFPKRGFEEILTDTTEANVAGGSVVDPGVTREAHIRVDETEVVAHLLRDRRGRSHIMLDVGAHFGTSAAYFDALNWTIHCFEPDPSNRARLEKRFSNNDNITIDVRAVSDEPATGVSFFTSAESTGISGLHAFRDTHQESGKVDLTTVSHIVDDRKIKAVDFLKIDVEGFDFSVLKGVPWDRIKPDVIECEFEDYKTVPLGHTYKEVADFLVGHGYAVYLSEWHPIIRYGIPHDWRRVLPYPSVDLQSDAWGNIVAFRNDPGLAAVSGAFKEVIERKNASTAKPSPVPQVVPSPAVASPAIKPPSAASTVMKDALAASHSPASAPAPAPAPARVAVQATSTGSLKTGDAKAPKTEGRLPVSIAASPPPPVVSSVKPAAAFISGGHRPAAPPTEPKSVSAAAGVIDSGSQPAKPSTHANGLAAIPAATSAAKAIEPAVAVGRGSPNPARAAKTSGETPSGAFAEAAPKTQAAASSAAVAAVAAAAPSPAIAAPVKTPVAAVNGVSAPLTAHEAARATSVKGATQPLTAPSPRAPQTSTQRPAATAPQPAPQPAAQPARHSRLAGWAAARSPLLFRAGQFSIWCLRTARRHKLAVLLFLLTLTALVAATVTVPSQSVRLLLAGAAVLVILAGVLVGVLGFIGHLLKRTENEAALRDKARQRALRALEDGLRSAQQAAATSTGAAIKGLMSDVSVRRAEANETKKRIESLEGRLRDHANAASKALGALDGRLGASVKASGDASGSLQTLLDKLAAKVDQIDRHSQASKEVGDTVQAAIGTLAGKIDRIDRDSDANRKAGDWTKAAIARLGERIGQVDLEALVSAVRHTSGETADVMKRHVALEQRLTSSEHQAAETIEAVGALRAELAEGIETKAAETVAALRAELEEGMAARTVETTAALRNELQEFAQGVDAKAAETVDALRAEVARGVEAKVTETIAALRAEVAGSLEAEVAETTAALRAEFAGSVEAKVAETTATLRAEFAKGVEAKVAETTAALRAEFAKGVEAKVAETTAALRAEFAKGVEAKVAETMAALRAEFAEGAAAKTVETMGTLRAEIAQGAEAKAAEAAERVRTEIAPRLDGFEKKLASVDQLGDVQQFKVRADTAFNDLQAIKRSSSLMNVPQFQYFKRSLGAEEIDTILNDWTKPLGIEVKRNQLAYMAHRAATLETQMRGRLATSIETIVLRCLVCLAVKRDDLSILEIGTLFGVGAAAIYDTVAHEFDSVHLTVIDPLDGYYGAENRDILSGARINERTLLQNWRIAQIPTENITIIKHLSETAEAIDAAKAREYDVLIIDGDHSRQGVKQDFENYIDMVRPGGFVLFDDYGVDDWPDIKSYVDEEVQGRNFLQRTGAGFRTAVFQMRKRRARAKPARN